VWYSQLYGIVVMAGLGEGGAAPTPCATHPSNLTELSPAPHPPGVLDPSQGAAPRIYIVGLGF